eukprot:TRINITY_DN10279_c0_g1_i1.p1 TRINITY_DN10279_c0_g1~~TRINITY_DN10279_c0_g1_i1.p1  ORF type:complete len:279 (-),score=91.11 TRINITY_DN10279_c0_g1_i1:336-1172(-)
MIRRPPRSTLSSSSAASDVYKRQGINAEYGDSRFPMSAMFEAASATARSLLETEIPAKIGALDQAVASKFSKSLAEVESFCRDAVKAKLAEEKPSETGLNADITEMSSFARAELATSMDTLRSLELWLHLSVPQISDGNNFGVEIQEHIIKRVEAAKVAAKTQFDGLKSYHSDRAGAWEKSVFASTTKQSWSEDAKQTTGGEKPEETTTNSSSVNKTANLVSNDAIENIVAIDVAHYFNLRAAVLETIKLYAVTLDLVVKNKDKLADPRGEDNQYSMF